MQISNKKKFNLKLTKQSVFIRLYLTADLRLIKMSILKKNVNAAWAIVKSGQRIDKIWEICCCDQAIKILFYCTNYDRKYPIGAVMGK